MSDLPPAPTFDEALEQQLRNNPDDPYAPHRALATMVHALWAHQTVSRTLAVQETEALKAQIDRCCALAERLERAVNELEEWLGRQEAKIRQLGGGEA